MSTDGGNGRVTMADLARIAGVSVPTVSRALRNIDSVGIETRQRIQALAAEHGFVANPAAQALRGVASRKIAIIIDFTGKGPGRASPDAFVFELLADVAHALTIRDFEIALSPREPSVERYLRQLAEIGATGAIFLGQGGQHELLQELAGRFPFVVYGAVMPDSTYCTVGSDNLAGGELAGRELARRGCRRALLLGDPETDQVRLRFEGFTSGFTGSHSTLAIRGFSYEGAYHALQERLRSEIDRPDGVFAASDTLAMAVIRAAREAGLAAPDDLSVIGYNDIPQSQIFEPPLTTIREDDHRAGSLLVEKLMQIRDGVRASSARLGVSLVVRDT